VSPSLQKNYRIPREEAEVIDMLAAALGVSQAVVVREGVERVKRDPQLKYVVPSRRRRTLEAESGNRGGPPLDREVLDEGGRSVATGRAPASPRAPVLPQGFVVDEPIEADSLPGRSGPSEPSSGPEAGVDLATWLSGRTGIPRALVARDVARGRVRVRGEPTTAERVPGPLRDGEVELDGRPV
jgi:hypothetical protein